MRFTVTYPLIAHPANPEFLSPDGMRRFCETAEWAGFDGVGFTDHPSPSHRWLQAGGHDALDPLVALAYCAGITHRLRLIPNILVLPYRNPFLLAKSVTTLDIVSGGRFTLAVASGYLRREFEALGVGFDDRNQRFDEALVLLRRIWTEDDLHVAGTDFDARGVTASPRPATPPPIWVGGNSKVARRRVARFGDGWSPFPAPAMLASTAKTAPLETEDDFAVMVEELWGFLDDEGRDPEEIDIVFGTSRGGDPASEDFDASERLAGLAALADLGVTWTGVGVPSDSLSHALESLEAIGSSVIQPLRAGETQ